ncbi:hypothetical protein U0070_024288 [Myodes glareolus]|uniref:Akirin-2 n=1 Tax=Myodes glareolus TaxID=447135 RepID=A0AAW0I9B7_MYOGA
MIYLTVTSDEQILYNIKQEYKRMQKRRHLEASFQQTDPGCSSDSQPHAFLIRTSSATSSPLKKEQPLFTLRQVGMICERLLKEREEKMFHESRFLHLWDALFLVELLQEVPTMTCNNASTHLKCERQNPELLAFFHYNGTANFEYFCGADIWDLSLTNLSLY